MRDLQEAHDAYYAALNRVRPDLVVESPVMQSMLQRDMRRRRQKRQGSRPQPKPKPKPQDKPIGTGTRTVGDRHRAQSMRGHKHYKRHEKKIFGIAVPTSKRGLKRQLLKGLG